MFMKYFELMIFSAALLIGAGAWLYYMQTLKAAFYRAMLLQAVMKLRKQNESLVFVSDYALAQAAKQLARHPQKRCRKLLNEARQGNYAPLINEIKAKNEVLSLGALAHFAPQEAEKQIKILLKSMPDNAELLLWNAKFCALKFDYAALKKHLRSLNTKKLNTLAKAELMLLAAKLSVYESDMAAAVSLLGKAGKIFKRRRCYYSESEVYFTAGEAYRVCAISDVSQMMFETAGNIAAKIGGKNEEAKILAAKGMLTAGQNRFAEAADFFKRSRKIFHQAGFAKSEAEIINQQALLFVIRGKLAMAIKYAKQGLALHKKCRNVAGEGQSAEIMAMAFFRQKEYAEALEYALAAQKAYMQTKNYAAYFDAAFLEIQALFTQNMLSAAENRCLQILPLTKKHKTGFYVADIYGFLGMIYLRQEKLAEAKKMFCRSAALEVKSKRDAGLVSDYINLTLIEYKLGHYQKAKNYAGKAVAAAVRTGDEALCAEVKSRLGKFY